MTKVKSRSLSIFPYYTVTSTFSNITFWKSLIKPFKTQNVTKKGDYSVFTFVYVITPVITSSRP